MKKVFLVFALILTFISYGQENSVLEFANPLDVTVNASGNFGELRGSHFHTGLDIKTQQRIGLPIYAPADGYVSRIKVSTWGYGKALYIDHPNGQTTVYGHLDRYEGDIAKYVLNGHYKEKSFEIELFPKKNELAVKKGQIIGYTGNTGGSGGPHLHYEFRDTKTQKIINPLAEGMQKMLVDTEAPTVGSIYVYPISETAVVNEKTIPFQLSYKTNPNGVLVADPIKANGTIGFGIDVYDTSNYNTNKNGVYKLETFVNGKPSFSYQFDTFSFDETGFVNALIDYERSLQTKVKVQKLFVNQMFPLSVLKVDQNSKGAITVAPGDSYNYKIIASDYHGNKTIVEIPIQYQQSTIKPKTKSQNKAKWYPIVSTKEYVFDDKNASITIPANTFYENFDFNFEANDKVISVHKDVLPGFKSMVVTVDMTPYNLTDDQLAKTYLARMAKDGSKNYIKTYKKDKKFTIYTKNLGNYTFAIDTVAPKIYQPSFKEGDWQSNAKSISFLVQDNESGIDSISGTINGQWILLDYDYKTNKIEHQFSDGIVKSGRNNVEIKVKDKMGNEQVFNTHFFRK